MTESGSADRIGRGNKITEPEHYQPFIIRVLHRHTVRAGSHSRIPGEIVFIATTAIPRRIWDAYGARRELGKINRVDRVANGHSKTKRRQHCLELNDENPVASPGKIVG